MKGPSLQITTVISAALHLTFFLIAAIILRHSRTAIMPSPYEVSLVGPTSPSRGAATEEVSGKSEQGTTATVPDRKIDKPVRDTKADANRLDDQIAALKAKKKVDRIVDLRRKVASISSSQGKSSPKNTLRGTGAGSSQGAATYMDKIVGEIKAGWVYPDWAEKDLLMIINVKIQRDGTIQVLEVEKKSGNPLFDRSVQQAIIKASPVTAPTTEMEIGMRFYP